jgi:hypothetical protein
MKIYVAIMETTNYTFRAVGLTYDDANKALRRGWNKWRKGCEAHVMPWKEAEEGYGVCVYTFQPGGCYVDDDQELSMLKTAKGAPK